MWSVGLEHQQQHHHHHHHHRPPHISNLHLGEEGDEHAEESRLGHFFHQSRGRSSRHGAAGDTQNNVSSSLLQQQQQRYHDLASTSSPSPSSAASLTFPHLRHHHHGSRNHGINGTTSSTSSLFRFGGAKPGGGGSSGSLLSSNPDASRKMVSFSGGGESERGGGSSVRTMFPSRETGGGGGAYGSENNGELFGENETLVSPRSHRFLSPSTDNNNNNNGGMLLADHLHESSGTENGDGGVSMNSFGGATSPGHYSNANNGTITSNFSHNNNSHNKSWSPATAALEQLVSPIPKSDGDDDDDGSGSVNNNYYLSSTRSVINGGHISPFNYSFDEMLSGGGGGITSFQLENDNNGSTFYTNGTSILDTLNGTSGDTSSVSIRGNLYASIVPVMLFFCVLAVLVNLLIVISARWCRKPMSPTLYFSISLALADAYAAGILATGLVINSLLPFVFGYQGLPICLSLVVEAFRQGGILVTVTHLLALAMNHWIGIVRPLHYAATMTRRTAWTVIIFSWICPITMIFIYYSSVAGEGFQSPGCVNYNFLKERAYRAFFGSCFFAPLILMSFIYIHIFIIVRNHHTHRQRFQSTQQLKRNVKAVLTTMLVLGTYIIGWMPAILFSLIACSDCIYDTEDLPSVVRYSVGFTTNLLVILKTLVDPVIYAARMSDIQMALKKMRYDILATFCKSCAPEAPPNDRGFSKYDRSFYETKSMRMSTYGRCSTRRMMMTGGASATGTAAVVAAANANLLLHSATGGTDHHRRASSVHHHHNFHNNQESHKQQNGTGTTNGYLVGSPTLSSSDNCNNHANCPNGNSGAGRMSFGNQQPLLINSTKSAFEMAEIN